MLHSLFLKCLSSDILSHSSGMTGRGESGHSYHGIRSRERRTIPLTLKAQIFPVISVEGTVKLGAGQLLVDGLEHSAMHWVLAIQATCPKTHHALYWIALQGRTECLLENGTVKVDPDCV